MQVMTQLATFLANKPGTLSDLARLLAEAGVNVLGITVADSIDHAVVRMVVDTPHKALHLLGDHGLLVVDAEVVAIDLGNEPGKIARVADKLGAVGVNIEYAYGGVAPTWDSGYIFMRVSDVEKAREALADL